MKIEQVKVKEFGDSELTSMVIRFNPPISEQDAKDWIDSRFQAFSSGPGGYYAHWPMVRKLSRKRYMVEQWSGLDI